LKRLDYKFFFLNRVSPILQTERAECGLACLAMIANFWGHKIDIENMRRRFSVSLKGVTLKSLISMSRALHFIPRPIKAELHQLDLLKLPCILHWDMNHFVVLTKIKNNKITILDPAVGLRQMNLAEFGRHFTGVVLELVPSNEFEQKKEENRVSYKSLVRQIKGLNYAIGHILILGLAIQICSLISPLYIQWTLDKVLPYNDHQLITVLGIGFSILVVLNTTLSALRSWATTVLATQINYQWLSNTFAHLLKLPMAFFEKRHTGDIISRFGSIQTIQHSITTQFAEGVIDGLLVIGTFTMMLTYSWTLTLITFVSVLLYLFLRIILFKALRNASSEEIIQTARQQTSFLETVRGMQGIRLFGRSNERLVGWLNILTDQFNANLRGARISVSYHAFRGILFGIERVAIIWLATIAVLDNKFSTGMLFAFLSYKEQFTERITSLINIVFDMRMLKLHVERLADIVNAEPEDIGEQQEIEVSHSNASIEFVNVSFKYSDNEPYILKNINLIIPSGQSIAITGQSGCGKTTLIKILLGLIEPTEGEVKYGGLSLRKLGLDNYRRYLGAVMQEDQLFTGSIADNICFFDPSPDTNRIEHCANLAAIHQEIVKMPMAYNSLVGDIGTGLSGGQKQRILLARALYKEPKLLVLDEATSHLDVQNEAFVNSAIKGLTLTRVIVAHRPETISMADRMIVLKSGSITYDEN